MVGRLFLAVPRGCLQFVIVVFPDHAHLLFSKCITPSIADQKSKAPVTQSRFRPRFTTTRPDLNQMVKSGCVRMEKKKIEHQYSVSITMLQRWLSARLIYGSSKSHDGSARIHHGGAMNAQDASTIQYGASTIQAGSARVASRPPMNVHDLVIVMPQSWGGGGYSQTLIFSSYAGSTQHLPFTQKNIRSFKHPKKN